jgi:hypothetical protein
LFEFHKRLRLLTFFDPACGCGNFLVITYRELRKLEVEILRTSYGDGQQMLDVHQFTTVDVDQFYGIEIEEFPAQIAQVAMWLTDHQMNRALSDEFGKYFDRLPLKSTPHIRHGNALQIDWQDVLPSERCSYVLGNPPFVGKKEQSPKQKTDVAPVFKPLKSSGVLDFVAAWYIKATEYIKNNVEVECAFVSTNSISQGEQVSVLWSWLLAQGIRINFAHRTFQWSNEASGKAAVHCVIIGFSKKNRTTKIIYDYEHVKAVPSASVVQNISPYLTNTPDVVVTKRMTPVSPVLEMVFGSKAVDFGHYVFDEQEMLDFVAQEPGSKALFRSYLGGEELINNTKRYCLWLKDAQPADLRKMPLVMERVDRVKQARLASAKEPTRNMANYATLFGEDRQPVSDYLVFPKVSSENRDYVPLAFAKSEVIINPSVLVIPNAGLLEFGILQSNLHMAWMRAVCGRLESRYQYSNTIVYNNYPWPTFKEKPSKVQVSTAQAAIESAAQAVLDARAQFPGSSLADLYDPLTMPPALVKAHQKLDAAVDAAYAQDAVHPGKKTYTTDAERVAYLFELYQRLTSLLPTDKMKKKR